MHKIAFRPYRGNDREELIESNAVQSALQVLLPGSIEIVDEFPIDATHAFGRTKQHSRFPKTISYPKPEHVHTPYWEWQGVLEHLGRSCSVLDLQGAKAKVAEIHASGKDAFVKATRHKFYVSRVPRGTSLMEHLDALAYSFIDMGPCLMVQDCVEMVREYRIFVVDGVMVTGAGNVASHTPDDNLAPFNPLVSAHPTDNDCDHDQDQVDTYLEFAATVIPGIPSPSFVLDVAMIEGKPAIVEINPLHLGQIGLFGSDARRLTAAVLQSCGLIEAQA